MKKIFPFPDKNDKIQTRNKHPHDAEERDPVERTNSLPWFKNHFSGGDGASVCFSMNLPLCGAISIFQHSLHETEETVFVSFREKRPFAGA
jgi:hypothetical protein